MARRGSAGAKRPGKPTKAELAAENTRLRRALARQTRRADALARGRAAEAGDPPEPAAALGAAREQQAATAEILRLIAASPDDAQPVFDAIARHALRLCGGLTCLVTRYDGNLLHLAAHENVYYAQLRSQHVSPAWIGGGISLEPRSKAIPYVWRWRDLRPQAMRAAQLVGTEQAE